MTLNKNIHLAFAIFDAVLVAWNFNDFLRHGSYLGLGLAAIMAWFGYKELNYYMEMRADERQ